MSVRELLREEHPVEMGWTVVSLLGGRSTELTDPSQGHSQGEFSATDNRVASSLGRGLSGKPVENQRGTQKRLIPGIARPALFLQRLR